MYMKIAILAGGLGTRISEETDSKPKPMVLIDDKPILWHLMNTFAVQGFDEFVLALGYKSEVIKRWLVDRILRKYWNWQWKLPKLSILTTGLIFERKGVKLLSEDRE